MSEGAPGDGLIRWRDLDQHREAEARAIEQHRDTVANSLSALDERWSIRHQAIESRVNSIEAVLDQQRGAKALIYFLIGSNLLAVLAVAWGVFK